MPTVSTATRFQCEQSLDRRDANGAEFLSPRVNYNDFGGTLGRPIHKNQTFFFFSWETSFLHQNKNQIYTIPTAREQRGDFSDRPDLGVCPTCAIYDPYSTVGVDANGEFSRTPFTGNIIPASRINRWQRFMHRASQPRISSTHCSRAAVDAVLFAITSLEWSEAALRRTTCR